jgi:ubiquinone/menaquinone biosynthesis C-methylase UbiE
MHLSRNLTIKIHFLFDQMIPPVLRDRRFFMWLPMKMLYKHKAHVFLDFKERAFTLSKKEYANVYREVAPVNVERETDMNKECIAAVLDNIVGKTVLEVGCGKCYLSNLMAEKFSVTSTDIVIDPQYPKKHTNIKFIEADIEQLPFPDKSFDTVVSSHTLEHVQNIHKSVQELRRVTRRRLIIVVPKQRPYKHTFDLHLHFFPYKHSLLGLMGTECRRNFISVRGGDLFYYEDRD